MYAREGKDFRVRLTACKGATTLFVCDFSKAHSIRDCSESPTAYVVAAAGSKGVDGAGAKSYYVPGASNSHLSYFMSVKGSAGEEASDRSGTYELEVLTGNVADQDEATYRELRLDGIKVTVNQWKEGSGSNMDAAAAPATGDAKKTKTQAQTYLSISWPAAQLINKFGKVVGRANAVYKVYAVETTSVSKGAVTYTSCGLERLGLDATAPPVIVYGTNSIYSAAGTDGGVLELPLRELKPETDYTFGLVAVCDHACMGGGAGRVEPIDPSKKIQDGDCELVGGSGCVCMYVCIRRLRVYTACCACSGLWVSTRRRV